MLVNKNIQTETEQTEQSNNDNKYSPDLNFRDG